MSRLLIKGSLLGGSLVAGYYGYQHWKNIQIYPAEARSELRSALRAMHNGKSGDAEKKFHNALDICVKTHGESSMAEFYNDRNRPDRAAQIYEKLLEAPSSEWDVGVRKSLADTYTEMNNLEPALKLYTEVLESSEKLNAASTIGPVYEGIGDVKFKQNDLNAAIEAYSKASEYCKKDQGVKSLENIILLNNIASCHFAKNDPESREEAAKVAISALLLSKSVRDPRIQEIVQNLEIVARRGS